MEKSRSPMKIILCVTTFCALSIGCWSGLNQLRVPFLGFDSVVQRFNEEASPAFAQGIPSCRFQSCSDGATTCHDRGNLKGVGPKAD